MAEQNELEIEKKEENPTEKSAAADQDMSPKELNAGLEAIILSAKYVF